VKLRLQNYRYASSSTTGKEHFINEHNGFNSLMTQLCRQTGLLKQDEKYMMDYDGHIIENNKLNNATTYKYSEGYYPVLCSINKLPIYLQNRNGNTPESYNQKSSIAAALEQSEIILSPKFVISFFLVIFGL